MVFVNRGLLSPEWGRRLRLPAVLLVAAALKAGLLAADVVPFHGDEAVVGLMARHILQGERPVFFYGQAYMGSLDAWLIAGAFRLLGESVLAMRLVQVALYLGTIATAFWLGWRIFRSQWIAGAAALFLAIPPVLVTLYTTATLGNYGETLLLGNLLLLLVLHLVPGRRPAQPGEATSSQPGRAARIGGWLLLGALAGLGFWGLPLIGVYLLPVLVYAAGLQWNDRRALAGQAALFALGFAVGAAPWLGYTLQHGAVTVAASTGAGMPAPPGNPVFAVFRHIFYFLLFGLTVIWGLRPPWSAEFLALPLVPYALALQLGALVFVARRAARQHDAARDGRLLLLGVVVTLVSAYILTPYGEDPSGRYFLPLAVPLALFLAEMLHWLRLRRRKRRTPWRKWFAQTLALGYIAFAWWGNVQAAADFPPGITTQFSELVQVDQRRLPELMAFLRAQGETRGYSNYWVSFPLAFLSGEELVYSARLPYQLNLRLAARDDRYPRYPELVEASPRVAYITTRHPALDARLRHGLRALGVGFQEATFGDFHVFYQLSRRVAPEELGLEPACC